MWATCVEVEAEVEGREKAWMWATCVEVEAEVEGRHGCGRPALRLRLRKDILAVALHYSTLSDLISRLSSIQISSNRENNSFNVESVK